MSNLDLRSVRLQRGWKQQELAELLHVSQTLVSLWEEGLRTFSLKHLERLEKLGVELSPTSLPFHGVGSKPRDYAQEVADLGYPGFAHFAKGKSRWNPAQLLVLALSENKLDRRTAESLPWLVLHFADMDWDWVFRESKVRDLQNRLGFTLTLARELAEKKSQEGAAVRLREQEAKLRPSLLAKEDTFCNDTMTLSERRWFQEHRSPQAKHWHILSNLEPSVLTHA